MSKAPLKQNEADRPPVRDHDGCTCKGKCKTCRCNQQGNDAEPLDTLII